MKTINKIRINSFPKRTEEDTVGEELITKVRRILDENEPLTDGAPLIYTPKEKGVVPEYNIRTDKWEIAMGAMDRVSEYKMSEFMKKSDRGTENSENGKNNEPNSNNAQETTTTTSDTQQSA